MSFNRILIALEDNVSVMDIVDQSVTLAKSLCAELGIVYIDNQKENDNLIPEDTKHAIQKRHDLLLDEINILYPMVKIEEFNPILNPDTKVKVLVDQWNPNLFIIGYHPHGFENKIFGCFTHKDLLETLKIPTLIIPNSI